MATLTLGGKTVLTQTGSDEPVLGSNLTGSPALNLSSSTFPAGHIIQYIPNFQSIGTTLDGGPNWNEVNSSLRITFNRKQTGSKIIGYVYSPQPRGEYSTGTYVNVSIGIDWTGATTSTNKLWGNAGFGNYMPYVTGARIPTIWHSKPIDSPSSETVFTIVYQGNSSGSPYHAFNEGTGDAGLVITEYMP